MPVVCSVVEPRQVSFSQSVFTQAIRTSSQHPETAWKSCNLHVLAAVRWASLWGQVCNLPGQADKLDGAIHFAEVVQQTRLNLLLFLPHGKGLDAVRQRHEGVLLASAQITHPLEDVLIDIVDEHEAIVVRLG